MTDYGVYTFLAEQVARLAHKGQVRKTGGGYIQHPARVADSLPPGLRALGWLHDVTEDCSEFRDVDGRLVIPGWVRSELHSEIAGLKTAFPQIFPPEMIAAVYGLSRREDEQYDHFIARAGAREDTRLVKIADIRDNLRDLKPGSLRDKYRLALRLLGEIP